MCENFVGKRIWSSVRFIYLHNWEVNCAEVVFPTTSDAKMFLSFNLVFNLDKCLHALTCVTRRKETIQCVSWVCFIYRNMSIGIRKRRAENQRTRKPEPENFISPCRIYSKMLTDRRFSCLCSVFLQMLQGLPLCQQTPPTTFWRVNRWLWCVTVMLTLQLITAGSTGTNLCTTTNQNSSSSRSSRLTPEGIPAGLWISWGSPAVTSWLMLNVRI